MFVWKQHRRQIRDLVVKICYFPFELFTAVNEVTFTLHDQNWFRSKIFIVNSIFTPSPLFWNKHCEVLVSCSEKYWSLRNCMQTHGTACKHMKLHTSMWNCMQEYETACKHMNLHASLWHFMEAASLGNCMQGHVTACKVVELNYMKAF